MASKDYKENLVLCISLKGPHRDSLTKEMRQASLEASYVTELNAVTDLIAELRPSTLIHDWGAVDTSQAMGFQQRLAKIADYASLCRIIYTSEITPQLVAVAADSGIKRVVLYGPNHSNLIFEIKTILSASQHLSELQVLMAKAQTEGFYEQKGIDEQIERAYTQFAHDPVVKLEYANLCCRRNELDKAQAIAAELLSSQPQNVRAMNLMSKIMMKQGKADEAIAVLEKANILSPFNTDRLLLLGDSFMTVGQTGKAAQYYQQAADTDPGNAAAQKGLGQVRLSEGDLNGALDLLRNSASEDEGAGFFNNAAVLASRAGNHLKAFQLYEAALQLLRTNKYKAALYFNMSLTQERLGNIEESFKLVKRSLKYDETFAKSSRQLDRLERKLKPSRKHAS